MSVLLRRILTTYMNAAGEDGTPAGGGTANRPGYHPFEPGNLEPPPAEALEELGMTVEDFKALSLRDQQNILAEGELDDVTPIETEEQAAAAREAAKQPPAAKWTAAPPKEGEPPAPKKEEKAPPAKEAAKDGSDGADPDEEKPAAKPAAQQAAADTPPPAVEVPEGAYVAEGEVLALPDLPPVPKWTPIVTPEARKELETARGELEKLEKQFEEGDLTRSEWQAARKPLQEKVEQINADLAADRVAQTMVNNQLKERFDSWVQASMVQAKAAGIDYGDPANVELVKQLDESLQRFGRAADLMFPGKSVDFRDRWALNQAHAEVAKAKGIDFKPVLEAAAATTKPATTAKPAATAKPGPRQPPDLSQMPPTTRNAPPAADSHIPADEFAHLDGLPPAELEKAVARMSEAQMERYLDR